VLFDHDPFVDLRKLFIDVFDPQPGETAAVFIDIPHGRLVDNDEWRTRRAMATRWHNALSSLAAERRFEVLPLVSFNATGGNNAQVPPEGMQSGRAISLEEIAKRVTLLLAMTEFSASAPLIGWTKQFKLRAASMPRVAPQMESSALAADYAHVARSCARLRDRLAKACMADIEFSTGDSFRFDFRFRKAEVDDGHLPMTAPAPRLINLPSGEAFIAGYEGEKGVASETSGVLPIPWQNEIVRARVVQNRVEEIVGSTPASSDLREFLFADAARCNVAELGLGCNPMARVWGNVLEDEKAGPHIALGRSEHLGGTVGPSAFRDARNVWHEDFVYARGCPVQVVRMELVDEAGGRKPLFANGSYTADLEIGI
jgi:leucyl aminopeptidase (aminopeptidase T)